LKNGNLITGEIKKLEYGLLTYKTDDISTLTVKWRDVMKLWSKETFEMTYSTGDTYFGSLDTTSNAREIVLVIGGTRLIIQMDSLVKIFQVKKSFLQRVDGSINAGFNYTRSSKVLKFSFSEDAGYTTFQHRVNLNSSSEITQQKISDSTDLTEKQDLNLSYYRYFKDRWFVVTFSGVEQNTGLGLDSRVQIGAGGGKELFQNNLNAINVLSGLIGNRERPTEGESTNNLEATAVIQYRIYKYSIPKVILSSSLGGFANLTDWGRLRASADLKVDFEFYKDFIFSISGYYDFDNKPASEGAAKYDWGLNTSVGYTF
jgi:hypothetical protein